MNRDKKKITAKDASSSVIRSRYELALGWGSGKYLIYAWILLMILSIILTLIIQNWAEDIDPAGSNINMGLSVTRLDRNRLEVMIISTEKDTDIEYLTYYTSRGTGYINKTGDPVSAVRDAGDSGIIPVSGYDEKVEIFAITHYRKIRVYSETE